MVSGLGDHERQQTVQRQKAPRRTGRRRGGQAEHPHPGKPDLVLLAATAALLAFNVAASVSAAQIPGRTFLASSLLLRLPAGLAILYLSSRVDCRAYREHRVLLAIATFLVLGVALSPLGVPIRGARSWVELPIPNLSIYLHACDLGAGLLILVLSSAVVPVPSGDSREPSWAPCIMLLASVLLVLTQAALVGACILMLTGCYVLFVTGRYPIRRIAAVAVSAALPLLLYVRATPWKLDTLVAFLDPNSDPSGSGWTLTRSLRAMEIGGLAGVGLGHGVVKASIPLVQPYLVISLIAEELGAAGVTIAMLSLAALTARGFAVARNLPDAYDRVLAASVTFYISLRASVHIGAAVGMLPSVAVALPLVSSDVTGNLVDLALIGVLLNLSRQVPAPPPVWPRAARHAVWVVRRAAEAVTRRVEKHIIYRILAILGLLTGLVIAVRQLIMLFLMGGRQP